MWFDGKYWYQYWTKSSGPYRIDTTSPSVSASTTSRDWSSSNISVTLSFSDSGGSGYWDSQVAWSESTNEPTSGWSWSSANPRTVTHTQDGRWYLHVRADDYAYNRRTTYFGRYFKDSTPPTIGFNPNYRFWSPSDISVTLTFNDVTSGLREQRAAWSTIDFVKPSSGWFAVTSGTPVTHTQNGRWYLHVEAYDNANNYAYSYRGPYEKDNILPTISANPPSRDWSVENIAVTLSFSDSGGSGFKDARFRWSKEGYWSDWSNWSGNNPQYPSQSMEGIWHLHVEARDNANNLVNTTFGEYKKSSPGPDNYEPNDTIATAYRLYSGPKSSYKIGRASCRERV